MELNPVFVNELRQNIIRRKPVMAVAIWACITFVVIYLAQFVGGSGDLFAMLAESLFLDMLPGPFSSGKRSDYSNITQQLSGAAGANSLSGGIVLPQTFSRRYASCGLSKIEIPIDAIRGASAAQLAGEILESFVRENEDPSMKSDVRTDLALHKIDREGIAGRYSESGEWKENIRREAAMALAAKPISKNYFLRCSKK